MTKLLTTGLVGLVIVVTQPCCTDDIAIAMAEKDENSILQEPSVDGGESEMITAPLADDVAIESAYALPGCSDDPYDCNAAMDPSFDDGRSTPDGGTIRSQDICESQTVSGNLIIETGCQFVIAKYLDDEPVWSIQMPRDFSYIDSDLGVAAAGKMAARVATTITLAGDLFVAGMFS